MKWLRNKLFVPCLICVLLVTSCKEMKDVEVKGIENFKITKMNKEGLNAIISVKIKNPNNFGFTIYSGQADVTLSNIPLGTSHLQKKIFIKANEEAVYDLYLHTSFEKINMKDILASITFSNFGKIKIDGYIKAGKVLLRKKIKVHYEGSPLSMGVTN